MKTINEKFTDEEFELLLKKKGEINWHDFIMLLTRLSQSFDDLPENDED